MAAADQAAKVAKTAAVIVGGWLLKNFGDKAAEEGYEKGKEAASKRSGDRRQRTLAQDMARAHGWKYTERHVIADQHRYVVWNDESSPWRRFPRSMAQRARKRSASASNSRTTRPPTTT